MRSCLRGFPDISARLARRGPQPADAGWRVVAPFMRGYAPSSLSADGSYHVDALMDRARCGCSGSGPDPPAVTPSSIGHDWGAISRRRRHSRDAGQPVRQSGHHFGAVCRRRSVRWAGCRAGPSWPLPVAPPAAAQLVPYLFFQLPGVAGAFGRAGGAQARGGTGPRATSAEDARTVLDAIGEPANWRAALGYYRAMVRGSRPPARYAALHQALAGGAGVADAAHLHARDHGCASPDYIEWVRRVLPPAGSASTWSTAVGISCSSTSRQRRHRRPHPGFHRAWQPTGSPRSARADVLDVLQDAQRHLLAVRVRGCTKQIWMPRWHRWRSRPDATRI